MTLIAIDPGPTESGVAFMEQYLPVHTGKVNNESLIQNLALPDQILDVKVVIEMVGHYGTGMPAGKTIFDTCVWIGRFYQFFIERGITPTLLKRGEVKLNLCNSARAKDQNVIQALADRFAPGKPNHGKGTKKSPGYFYGFKDDVWQAYALGVTYLDMEAP